MSCIMCLARCDLCIHERCFHIVDYIVVIFFFFIFCIFFFICIFF